jgi:hypothetical protein
MEANSLATPRMHLGHFERTLGAGFDLRKLTLADLQNYVNKRRKEGNPRRKQGEARPLSAATLRLEVASLRAAWNWAVLASLVKGAFPSKGPQYPKADGVLQVGERSQRLRPGSPGAIFGLEAE